MMDNNEDLNKGKLSRYLNQLGIQELFKEITGKRDQKRTSEGNTRLMKSGPQNILNVMQQDFFHCGQE